MGIDGLDLEVGIRHLRRKRRGELVGVGEDGAIVRDLGQELSGGEDGLGDVIRGQGAAGAADGGIVGVCEGFGCCLLVRVCRACKTSRQHTVGRDASEVVFAECAHIGSGRMFVCLEIELVASIINSLGMEAWTNRVSIDLLQLLVATGAPSQ